MDSSIIRTPRPQISRKSGKPVVFDAVDAVMLEAWRAEVLTLTTALHEAGMDATSRDRVHSRKELRRRLSKLMKQLHGMLEMVRPLQTPPAPAMASDAQLEKLRLVSAL